MMTVVVVMSPSSSSGLSNKDVNQMMIMAMKMTYSDCKHNQHFQDIMMKIGMILGSSQTMIMLIMTMQMMMIKVLMVRTNLNYYNHL